MAKTISRMWNTDEIKALIYSGAREGTLKCAEHLVEEARKLVPLRTGRLQISGDVYPTNTGYIVKFYADSHTDSGFDYAIIQHEDTSFSHRNGRTHHYLRIPLERNKEMYSRWIASAVGDKL